MSIISVQSFKADSLDCQPVIARMCKKIQGMKQQFLPSKRCMHVFNMPETSVLSFKLIA